MAPDKLIIDPAAAPLAMAVLVKAKDIVVTKGTGILVAAAMAVGGAAYKLDDTQKQLTAMSINMKEIQGYMLTMQKDMYLMKMDIALTKKDVNHIKDDIKQVTAQVGEMIAYRAKLRK